MNIVQGEGFPRPKRQKVNFRTGQKLHLAEIVMAIRSVEKERDEKQRRRGTSLARQDFIPPPTYVRQLSIPPRQDDHLSSFSGLNICTSGNPMANESLSMRGKGICSPFSLSHRHLYLARQHRSSMNARTRLISRAAALPLSLPSAAAPGALTFLPRLPLFLLAAVALLRPY